MKTKTLVLITLGVAAAVATSAWAATESFGERLATLNVTAAQKEQVRSILRQHQPTAGPLLNQLATERHKLRDTIRTAPVDEKAIRAQVAKVAGLEAELAVERAYIVQAIRPVLTPEQVAKLKDMQIDADDRIDGFLSRVAKQIAAD